MQTTLVQLAPEQIAQWLGHIDWLLLVTVYIGLQRDPFRAMLTGVAAGVIHDSFSGGTAMGVSGLAYVLAAFVTYQITSLIVVDNLLVRFGTVAAASLVNTAVRLLFYALLRISLPVLAGGSSVAASFIFALLVHLIASILLYIVLDRLFLKGESLRRRRSEARRRRL